MIDTHLNYILVGPCGAGKNTVMEYFKDKGFSPISATDLLRAAMQENNERGAMIRHCGETATPIPDKTIFSIIEPALKANLNRSFVMESFPYNLVQWSYLKKWLSSRKGNLIQKVVFIYLKTNSETILQRLSGRLTCPHCSRVFHITYNPPHKQGICDRCQGLLITRSWDSATTILKRLERFEKETIPVLNEIQKKRFPLVIMDGNHLWKAEEFAKALRDRQTIT